MGTVNTAHAGFARSPCRPWLDARPRLWIETHREIERDRERNKRERVGGSTQRQRYWDAKEENNLPYAFLQHATLTLLRVQ